MQFGGALELNGNELRNAVLQNLSSPPTSPRLGQVYYDTAIGTVRQWNGTAWINLDATKASNIPLSALATDPLARANHTGTQVAATISNLAATVQGYSLSSFAVPAANIPMGGFTFTGLATPAAAGQAAEYSWVLSQVQSAAAGISSKDPVAVIATANVATLSGLQNFDGVTGTVGMRTLLPAQTTASQNGVWVQQTGAWTRPATEGNTVELDPGATWLVTQGTVNAGTQWRLATVGTITPGTTPVSIVQFGAGNSYTAGNGLTLVGSAFAVGAGSGILVAAGTTSVDPAVVGRKAVGTITCDGTSTAFPVTHNLNNANVIVGFVETSSGDVFFPTISGRTANGLTVNINPVQVNGKQYGYTFVG